MGRHEVAPGTLHLVPGTPNPHGAEGAFLWLLDGDPTSAPITQIVPVAGSQLPPPGWGPGQPDPFHLHVLHFSDLHGHVTHTAPHGGGSSVLARMVGRVREMRHRSRVDPRHAVLFLSGGDDLAGGILWELLDTVHAGYRLSSTAGVDAGVIGNHDLDAGSGPLVRAIERDARFPLLSANLGASPELAGRVYPAALLVLKGLRVGLVGLTTRAEVRTSPSLQLGHPLTALHNLLPALRPLCDVLILLSHLGRSLDTVSAVTCDAGDLELAAGLSPGSVDLIVGGHSHDALNESGLSMSNLVNGIPIVQAGAMGRFLGEVLITIGPEAARDTLPCTCVGGEPAARGANLPRPEVSVASVRLIPTANLPSDVDFESQQIWPLVALTRPLVARSLGRVADHPDLTAEAVQAGLAAGESALANLVSDALLAGCRAAGHAADLAAVDASSFRCGLPVGGELTFGDWFELMPYADTLRLYRLTGRQLAALLDDNARRADRPGEPHTERGFLHFSRQVRYTIELGESRAAARAVGSLVGGLPLDQNPVRHYLVACTSFVRQAAAPWERHAAHQLGLSNFVRLGCPEADTDLLVRQLILTHLGRYGGATEEAGARRDGRLTVVLERGEPGADVVRPPDSRRIPRRIRLSELRAAMVDIDGTLFRGPSPLPGLRRLFAFLGSHGNPFVIVSNNATKTAGDYQALLATQGVEVLACQVLTAATATASYLARELGAGARLYVIGERALHEALSSAGFLLLADATRPADAVVVGGDSALTYVKLKDAALLLQRGARLVGTNPDLLCPSDEGLIPEAGTTLAALECATGVAPVVIGKPARPLFDLALELLGSRPEETAILGDRLETDVLGGQQAGMRTILVTTGVDDEGSIGQKGIAPDLVVRSLDELVDLWADELGTSPAQDLIIS